MTRDVNQTQILGGCGDGRISVREGPNGPNVKYMDILKNKT